MNSDGFKELFVPGGHYINAFDRNGNQLTVNPIFAPRQFWSEVATGLDQAVDLRGYAICGTENRPQFSDSAPVVADVDGDGIPELIVVGNVYNCGTTPYTSLYHMPFIFKLDRTRWSGSGFDWTAIPTPGPGSAPLSEDYNVIENVVPNAVVADLDGDGFKEIIFPSYDGKVHAYWLDKTEHGSWPYTVPTSGTPGDDFRFASEPVVVDLDNDGHAEVIFTSWPKRATGGVGQLHVLDYLGRELYRVSLPAPSIGKNWNGGLSAPTIANIDSDPNLELVVGTSASGVVAYKLPNTANARILWGTGRSNYGRTAVSVTVTAPPPPDTTPPSVPTGLTASAVSSSQINLSWAASSDNVGVSGYRVYRGGTQIATTSATSFTNTGLAPSTTYSYTVAAYDAAGNVSAQSSPASATTPAPPDTTPPSVTINQAASQADPTNSSPTNFTAVFSKPVSGFSGAGVAISGTAGGTKTVTVSGGPSTYNVAVSGMTTSGTVIASIPAGVAQEAAGHAHTTSTSTDNSVTFTSVSPTVLENQQPGSGNWQMWLHGIPPADDVNKQIKGYASATSVSKGESITFYVTVNPAQQYTMDVYRMGWYQGLGGRLMQCIGQLHGVAQPACPVDATTGLTECNWTAAYTLTVPTTWTSGVFMVQLTNAQGSQNYITFGVRDDARVADIMFQQAG